MKRKRLFATLYAAHLLGCLTGCAGADGSGPSTADGVSARPGARVQPGNMRDAGPRADTDISMPETRTDTGESPVPEERSDAVNDTDAEIGTDTAPEDEETRSAREACEKCDGRWGVHGKAGRPGCYCKTKDGGKRCWSGNDCEGRCDFPADESHQRKHCGPRRCSGRTFKPRTLKGRCAEYLDVFGCHAHLQETVVDGRRRQQFVHRCAD